ncbi:MAG: signal peptidase I [Clostridia bacterium]|nr:signal peptidase I [Clostridia bacterium]
MENKKMQKPIIQYAIIASLIFIIVYMLSGLVVTFGHNPYSTTIRGLIHNLWMLGTVIVAKEYIRYKLINNVYDKDKTKIALLISFVYVIIDFEFTKFIGHRIPIFTLTKYILQKTIPYIAINMVFSYTSIYSNCIPAIIYQLLTNLYFWVSPIIPNSPWIMVTIIDTSIPFVLFLYIRFTKNRLKHLKSRESIENSDPKNIIPLIVLIVLGVWFAVGIFPIKPVAIATGSMEKEICVGDVAIIKKCNANDVNVGDIIEYQMEGYTVIHRIIEKKQKNGEFYFVTKGDNNSTPDKEEVREDQLIGKNIFKIKYIGYPAIWLHILQVEDQMVDVDTGDKS